MSRRSRVNVPEEDTELNMTPMLDVVFILLIFFIVTSVFVKTPGIDPIEPYAESDVDWMPTILIGVNSVNEVWIDKRPYSVDEIRPVITGIRDESPKAVAIIKADRNAEVGTVMAVQDLMQELNIDTRIGTE